MIALVDTSAPPALVRDAASAWLQRFRDQRFSLTDAVSFEVMRRDKIDSAFAFDRHFVTAGFELLRASFTRGPCRAAP